MNEKIEKLETNMFMLSNNYHQQTGIENDHNSFDSCLNTFEKMITSLPLSNEESLMNFENLLLDMKFKKKVVLSFSLFKHIIYLDIVYIYI